MKWETIQQSGRTRAEQNRQEEVLSGALFSDSVAGKSGDRESSIGSSVASCSVSVCKMRLPMGLAPTARSL